MRITTHTLLIAATVATTLAVGQPALALTADEKREKSRLVAAERATLTRNAADVRLAFAKKCEAAFAADEPMPEKDLRIADPVVIDDDLMGMTSEEISEQFGIAAAAFDESDKAVNDCLRKYGKRNEGS
ncbi:hypothetical protein [Ruegeria atlantica]|uniref:hypothetical protein n=1 Tax=Ruegeria atlantica TaxID=81569 RepID=UPI00147A0A4F|nr:hypothetical protein [Ruegeria atlantica]